MTIYRIFLKHNKGNEEERTVAYTMFFEDARKICEKYEKKIEYYEKNGCWDPGEISVADMEFSVSERFLSKVLDDSIVDWQLRDFHQDFGRWC
jgi:hypothetical protein